MFQALYDWTLRLAHHRHAVRSLAVVSFAESSVFPIPPDAMLVPMILARRDQAYRIAGVCTVASVLGGVLGYVIGAFLFESLARPLLEFYHMVDRFEESRAWFDRYGAAVILVKGLTPIPFKLVTIASGAFAFSFPIFIATAAITRAFRFFLIAWLLKRYGAPVQDFIERRLTLIGWAVLLALAGGFFLVALI